MLQNYIRQLLVFAFILVSFNALGQSFGTSVSARYGDGCRLDFYNSTNVKIFSLRGSELRYWYNPSGQIIARDENTQVTDLYGITGLAALIDSVQSVCLAGLCSGSTPIETFSYCGAGVWDFYASNGSDIDTLSYCAASCSINPLVYEETYIRIHLWNAQNINLIGSYPFGDCVFSGNTCEQINYCADSINNLSCTLFSFFTASANEVPYNAVDSFACPPETMNIESLNYLLEVNQFDTIELYLKGINVNNDTIITQDIVIPYNNIDSFSVLRTLGIKFLDIDLDTTNAILEITAKPVKTSGQTYASSSFKIEKIAFADISSGTISGSTYNPNLGEQSNTFSLTTGKNTFKVSVEDTDGNIAYSIFQVTKTAL